MDEPKLISEREAIKRERVAFVMGIEEAAKSVGMARDGQRILHINGQSVKDIAARVFSLPKVRRPRVVMDPHAAGYAFRWQPTVASDSRGDGVIQSRFRADGPWTADTPSVTRERLCVWSELAANPTELVDDDSDASQEVSRG